MHFLVTALTNKNRTKNQVLAPIAKFLSPNANFLSNWQVTISCQENCSNQLSWNLDQVTDQGGMALT